SQAVPEPVKVRSGGVSENGWLQVVGTQLCNEAGSPVVLRGMSSHGLQWYGQFASAKAIAATAEYGANVFRAAMYTGEGGCLSQPGAMKAKVTAAVDGAIQNDMYVIIDWHILSDGNPMAHADEAEAFFTEMARRYKDVPNVLYEICNEPNGNVSWAGDVKPYAQRMVRAIRAQSPQAVILIGSPTWSQDIHLAAADPVDGANLMYTLHFYAGTHGRELRDRIDNALARGLPIFVSEWGTSRADGSGGVFLEQSKVWLDFLDQRGISWCNWSLCDKGETSAALRPGAPADGPWTADHLTESGRFVFSRFAP
ncbi:MAG: glycoside hydrolase family 5 protein, partial [Oscillospiraceae bacterium]|nr:glycoside hydrolase family 5 protein [Oscillospiraceae bacterium]